MPGCPCCVLHHQLCEPGREPHRPGQGTVSDLFTTVPSFCMLFWHAKGHCVHFTSAPAMPLSDDTSQTHHSPQSLLRAGKCRYFLVAGGRHQAKASMSSRTTEPGRTGAAVRRGTSGMEVVPCLQRRQRWAATRGDGRIAWRRTPTRTPLPFTSTGRAPKRVLSRTASCSRY